MQVVILESITQIRIYAAELINPGIDDGTVRTLGVATGSSPIPVYEGLERSGNADLSHLTAFALDEYVGLPDGHPQSYRAVIDREVTQRLGLRRENVHVPDGGSTDPSSAGERYERQIEAAGGIDLQILGIGTTGHIGFNEPTSSFASRTRIKTLTPATREANARFFDSIDDVPLHCITQGLGTIMEARSILLIAQGSHKAEAVARMVEGPVTSMCPGSILQFHQDVTIVLDEAAGSELTLADYYRFVFDNRPDWQR